MYMYTRDHDRNLFVTGTRHERRGSYMCRRVAEDANNLFETGRQML